MPTDFLENELEIGQYVVFQKKQYSFNEKFNIGEIVRFTSKMIRITYGKNETYYTHPHQVIVLSESETLRYQLGQRPVKGKWVDK